MTTRTWMLALTVGLVSCQCGEEKQKALPTVDKLPSTAAEMFQLLFAPRLAAKVERPEAALPATVDVALFSPDPAAWRSWAMQRDFIKRMVGTPLVTELRMSRAYLELDGLQHQAAQAAALVGKGDERDALWEGPTAIGVKFDGDQAAVIVLKKIDVSMESAIRFGAAFAMLGQSKHDEVTKTEVEGIDLYSMTVRKQQVCFAVFKNLLIAGNNAGLVEQAVHLARGQEAGSGAVAADPLLANAQGPGLHARIVAPPGSPAQLLGLDTFGVSLVMDPAAPAVIRMPPADGQALPLLRYAPEGSFLAVASGETVADELINEIGGVPLLDSQAAVTSALSPGAVAILGATGGETLGTFAGVLVFPHAGKKAELESSVAQLVKDATGKKPKRVVMEAHDAILLHAGGPAAGITKDALLLAMHPDRIRKAIAAGSGKAPSLADRVDVKSGDAGLYLDLAKASEFLNLFYRDALRKDGQTPWADAQHVLRPTFEALGSGGAAFAKLSKGKTASEGALRALP